MNTTSSPKTREQIASEIGAAVQNQTIQTLINALADANVRISTLEAELAKLKEPGSK